MDLRCEKIIYIETEKGFQVKLVDNGTSIFYTGQNINMLDLDYQFTDLLFCPPEFNSRNIFNEKSLVWTCGMILYFLISGNHLNILILVWDLCLRTYNSSYLT